MGIEPLEDRHSTLNPGMYLCVLCHLAQDNKSHHALVTHVNVKGETMIISSVVLASKATREESNSTLAFVCVKYCRQTLGLQLNEAV